jgi:hypothetical protein
MSLRKAQSGVKGKESAQGIDTENEVVKPWFVLKKAKSSAGRLIVFYSDCSPALQQWLVDPTVVPRKVQEAFALVAELFCIYSHGARIIGSFGGEYMLNFSHLDSWTIIMKELDQTELLNDYDVDKSQYAEFNKIVKTFFHSIKRVGRFYFTSAKITDVVETIREKVIKDGSLVQLHYHYARDCECTACTKACDEAVEAEKNKVHEVDCNCGDCGPTIQPPSSPTGTRLERVIRVISDKPYLLPVKLVLEVFILMFVGSVVVSDAVLDQPRFAFIPSSINWFKTKIAAVVSMKTQLYYYRCWRTIKNNPLTCVSIFTLAAGSGADLKNYYKKYKENGRAKFKLDNNNKELTKEQQEAIKKAAWVTAAGRIGKQMRDNMGTLMFLMSFTIALDKVLDIVTNTGLKARISRTMRDKNRHLTPDDGSQGLEDQPKGFKGFFSRKGLTTVLRLTFRFSWLPKTFSIICGSVIETLIEMSKHLDVYVLVAVIGFFCGYFTKEGLKKLRKLNSQTEPVQDAECLKQAEQIEVQVEGSKRNNKRKKKNKQIHDDEIYDSNGAHFRDNSRQRILDDYDAEQFRRGNFGPQEDDGNYDTPEDYMDDGYVEQPYRHAKSFKGVFKHIATSENKVYDSAALVKYYLHVVKDKVLHVPSNLFNAIKGNSDLVKQLKERKTQVLGNKKKATEEQKVQTLLKRGKLKYSKTEEEIQKEKPQVFSMGTFVVKPEVVAQPEVKPTEVVVEAKAVDPEIQERNKEQYLKEALAAVKSTPAKELLTTACEAVVSKQIPNRKERRRQVYRPKDKGHAAGCNCPKCNPEKKNHNKLIPVIGFSAALGVLTLVFGIPTVAAYVGAKIVRKVFGKNPECAHVATCPMKLKCSAGEVCNTACGGHNCTHWSECQPAVKETRGRGCNHQVDCPLRFPMNRLAAPYLCNTACSGPNCSHFSGCAARKKESAMANSPRIVLDNIDNKTCFITHHLDGSLYLANGWGFRDKMVTVAHTFLRDDYQSMEVGKSTTVYFKGNYYEVKCVKIDYRADIAIFEKPTGMGSFRGKDLVGTKDALKPSFNFNSEDKLIRKFSAGPATDNGTHKLDSEEGDSGTAILVDSECIVGMHAWGAGGHNGFIPLKVIMTFF